MDNNIKQALMTLAPLTTQLDRQDDIISNQIQAIETAIKELISVRISVDVPGGYLAFGKYHASWCLILGSGGHETPLLSCTRQRRADMLAGGHIERLVRDASVQIETMIEVRTRAMISADALISDLLP